VLPPRFRGIGPFRPPFDPFPLSVLKEMWGNASDRHTQSANVVSALHACKMMRFTFQSSRCWNWQRNEAYGIGRAASSAWVVRKSGEMQNSESGRYEKATKSLEDTLLCGD
jgi:hypothetical protein